MGTRCADHVTPLYPQKLALTSPTDGGRSVGIVRVRTKATEFSFSFMVRVYAALVLTVFEIEFLLKGSQSTADKKSSESLVKRISHKYMVRVHMLPHSTEALFIPHPKYKP